MNRTRSILAHRRLYLAILLVAMLVAALPHRAHPIQQGLTQLQATAAEILARLRLHIAVKETAP